MNCGIDYRVRFFFLFSLLTALAGCEEPPKTAEVSGTITMKGKPLQFVNVDFYPDVGPNARGRTDENGRYELRTMDQAYVLGAAIGANKVTLLDMWPARNDVMEESGTVVDNSKGEKGRISVKYADMGSTPLQFTVEGGKKNVFDIEVDPRGK